MDNNKHPIVHDIVQKEKGGIIKKTNDTKAHQHSAAPQQDNIPRDEEDNPIRFSGPKTVEKVKITEYYKSDHRMKKLYKSQISCSNTRLSSLSTEQNEREGWRLRRDEDTSEIID